MFLKRCWRLELFIEVVLEMGLFQVVWGLGFAILQSKLKGLVYNHELKLSWFFEGGQFFVFLRLEILDSSCRI